MTDFELEKQWKILSWNHDVNGIEFVSTIEHKKYPFYGTQFHPEKVLYEWIRNRGIAHTANAIQVGQWFAKFYVDESRRSLNKFSGLDEENRVLIYNYQPTFTGLVKSAFEQSYLFEGNADYRQLENVETSEGSVHGAPIMHAIHYVLVGISLVGINIFDDFVF